MKAPVFKILKECSISSINTPSTDPLEASETQPSEEELNFVKTEWNRKSEKAQRIMKQSKTIMKKSHSRPEISKEAQRNTWKKSEDDKLHELFRQYGPKWCKIASLLETRTPKQIRDRYLNVLKPDINHHPWTKEEDKLLIPLFKKFGKRWCRIAEQIPGRTENQVKNRFYCYLNKEVLKNDDFSPSRHKKYDVLHENHGYSQQNKLDEKQDHSFLESLSSDRKIPDIQNSFMKSIEEVSDINFLESLEPFEFPRFRTIPSLDELGADQFLQSYSGERLDQTLHRAVDNMTYESYFLE